MTKFRTTPLALAGALAVTATAIAFGPAVFAGDLFTDPGAKQTAQDFRPAPAKIETPEGALEFTGGGYPTGDTAQRAYDKLDLARATQAYLDFYPALSLYGIVKGQVRDYGFRSSSDIGVFANFMGPESLYLTGNNVTVYAVASLDLGVDGPTVVEIPPEMYGTADDAYFKYITDMGLTGPDKGKGGKYLFLPPGHDGKVPDGYFVMHSPSNRIWAMMRALGKDVGEGEQAVAYFQKHLKIYPLKTGPREGKTINISGKGINTLAPEDGTAFEWLHDIVSNEPIELFGMEQVGRLAALGIEKGKPFAPDARMKRILDQGAKEAVAMARAIVYASRDPDIRYWPERRWEVMFAGGNTEFVKHGYRNLDARTLWHYQAIVVAPALLSTTPGAGTAYLTNFRDKTGAYLDGSKTYKLNVPANVPVKRFWAVTAYDPSTRCQLDSKGPITIGTQSKPVANSDGSVDVYFGAKAPEGQEKNWIKTDPAKGFFVVFRFYGPLEGYINKTWTLNDFEIVE